jgi:hypothetical protein
MDDYTPPVDTTVTHTAFGKIPNSYEGGYNSNINSGWISPASAAHAGARDAEFLSNWAGAANNSAATVSSNEIPAYVPTNPFEILLRSVVAIVLVGAFVYWGFNIFSAFDKSRTNSNVIVYRDSFVEYVPHVGDIIEVVGRSRVQVVGHTASVKDGCRKLRSFAILRVTSEGNWWNPGFITAVDSQGTSVVVPRAKVLKVTDRTVRLTRLMTVTQSVSC